MILADVVVDYELDRGPEHYIYKDYERHIYLGCEEGVQDYQEHVYADYRQHDITRLTHSGTE